MVNLRPSTMVDLTDREMLLQETCEEVILRKSRDEVRRTARMPDEGECEVRMPVRYPPDKLITALAALADITCRSRRTVEKCLIWQGEAILSTIPGIRDMKTQLTGIRRLHGRNGGLSDLVSLIGASQYHHELGQRRRVDVRGASRVFVAIGDACEGLGATMGSTVSVALMLAVTTTQDGGLIGAAKDLMPEVHRFLQFVAERSVMMEAYWKIAQFRVDTPEEQRVSWRHTTGACWCM